MQVSTQNKKKSNLSPKHATSYFLSYKPKTKKEKEEGNTGKQNFS